MKHEGRIDQGMRSAFFRKNGPQADEFPAVPGENQERNRGDLEGLNHVRIAIPTETGQNRTLMKVILLGNAGAGKSTLAKKLIAKHPAARLSLDEVAFQRDAERRPLNESIADVTGFIAAHESWIIEGCYADIIEGILEHCEELVFLNPGIDACVAHCRARPWEPEKFRSSGEQDEKLENLIDWVQSYETREDEYGLPRHQAIYDAFLGRKRELNHPSQYESV